MNTRQQAMVAAIDSGMTTIRELMEVAGFRSTSVVKYNLETLAQQGHVVLVRRAGTLRAYSGHDVCAAWDASARLAGNEMA